MERRLQILFIAVFIEYGFIGLLPSASVSDGCKLI